MKCINLILAFLLSGSSIAQDFGKVVQAFSDQDLGHGYTLRWEHVDLKDCQTCFEGTAHYQALYWKSKRLGRAGQHSVSPSGSFAAWEDMDAGSKLLLFVRDSREVRDITSEKFDVPASFVWDEAKGELLITYDGHQNHAPSRINLKSTVDR